MRTTLIVFLLFSLMGCSENSSRGNYNGIPFEISLREDGSREITFSKGDARIRAYQEKDEKYFTKIDLREVPPGHDLERQFIKMDSIYSSSEVYKVTRHNVNGFNSIKEIDTGNLRLRLEFFDNDERPDFIAFDGNNINHALSHFSGLWDVNKAGNLIR